MTVAQQVGGLRKSGKLDEAENIARKGLDENPDDRYLQSAFGWVIYERLRNAVQQADKKQINDGQLPHIFDAYLRDYARLKHLHCPDLLHSLILTHVLKGAKMWRSFLAFAQWWGSDCFRDEDRKPYAPPDGRPQPSMEMRFAYAVGRALTDDHTDDRPELTAWAEQYLDEMLKRFPDDIWLSHYKSKFLISRNEKEEARVHLLAVVKRQQHASWAWGLLGRAWDGDSDENATICYRYAVVLADKEESVLKIRVKLAEVLARTGLFPEAALHVLEALALRERMSWKIPPDLLQLSQASWFINHSSDSPLQDPEKFRQDALQLLYKDVPYRLAVIDSQNVKKTLAHISFAPEDGGFLKYRHFPGIEAVPIGEIIEVAMDDKPRRVVRWRVTARTSIGGFVETIHGEVRAVSNKPFGFIVRRGKSDIFIPPWLMASLNNQGGALVEARVMQAYDKKKNRTGWKAISLKLENVENASSP